MTSLPKEASNIWQALFNNVPNLPRLSVPVPPNLERALGYVPATNAAPARFVAFWWDAHRDELAYADNDSMVVGATFVTWWTYTSHPKVHPGLEAFNFGGSESEASHVFILDRETRVAYAGPMPQPTAPQAEARLLEEHRQHDMLLAWLDGQG